MKDHYQLIILGGGPAGLSAGLYAARARLDHVLIEKGAAGGQVLLTDWVDNYPGFPEGISGWDLVEKMTEHAKRFDLNVETREVIKMDLDDEKKILHLDNGEQVSCDTLIICTGAKANTLNIPGEKELTGKGVSYCGTCDAPFYRNMHVAVVGGGNTAVQEADYLTKFASKVTIIHRRDELRATKVVQEVAFANEKIDYIWNSRVTSIEGDNGVERLNLLDNDGKTSRLEVDGVFILIGVTPNSAALPLEKLNADKWGFIPVDIETRTCVKGVMAAGDIVSKDVRQIVNAAGEGAVAVLAAEHYLQNMKNNSGDLDVFTRTFLYLFTVLHNFYFQGVPTKKINIFGSADDDADLAVPVGQLITKGMTQFNTGNYFLAERYFEQIIENYPFSPEATLAELKIADSKYFLKHYTEAELLYQEFEERHPTNEAVPYVIFQQGMCNYKRLDRTDRDITGARESIKIFSQLIRAYPNSPYTEEAKARIRAATEFLVYHEYEVVEFYLRTEKYDQAKTRLRYILNVYPDSAVAPRAKELLAKLEENKPIKEKKSWFPSFSLPDWHLFGSGDEKTMENGEVTQEAVDNINEQDIQ